MNEVEGRKNHITNQTKKMAIEDRNLSLRHTHTVKKVVG